MVFYKDFCRIHVSLDLTKKAVEMLLKGATLLSEPCPYCKGVRVMMNGNALCVMCGKEPDKTQKIEPKEEKEEKSSPAIEILEKKLQALSRNLSKKRIMKNSKKF